jgi:hypothetical protein
MILPQFAFASCIANLLDDPHCRNNRRKLHEKKSYARIALFFSWQPKMALKAA